MAMADSAIQKQAATGARALAAAALQSCRVAARDKAGLYKTDKCRLPRTQWNQKMGFARKRKTEAERLLLDLDRRALNQQKGCLAEGRGPCQVVRRITASQKYRKE
jgi:hypothetical protein